MTRDETKHLLEQVGFMFSKHIGTTYPAGALEDILYRLAALVAAHEREDCAKVVEESSLPDVYSEPALLDIAEAIRARGKS